MLLLLNNTSGLNHLVEKIEKKFPAIKHCHCKCVALDTALMMYTSDIILGFPRGKTDIRYTPYSISMSFSLSDLYSLMAKLPKR